MNDVPEEWSFLASAWRFARVMTGCSEGASKVFKDSIGELLHHPHGDEADRARPLLFSILRKRCLKYPASCELDGALADLHRQPEPTRSIQVLHALDVLPADRLQHILNVDKRIVADAVAQGNAEIAALVRELPLSDDAADQIKEAAKDLDSRHGGLHFSVRNPATLAVGFGFLLIVAVLVWHFLGQVGVFPDEAIKIATAGAKANPNQFEPVEDKAGALEDWFMLKGFDNFRVPPGFEHFDVVGVRSFKFENEAIGQAAANVADNTMFFYSFPAGPFGINVTPEKSWRITEVGRTVLAIREERGICFLVSFPGKKKDMVQLLEKAGFRL